MKTFKSFILEKQINSSFDHNPKIGFWKDQSHMIVYHGTHDKNVSDIKNNGLTKADPKTGMISVTHDPHTAHGYAAMSGTGGEHNFRQSGAKAVNTPHEKRSVIKMKIPMDWAKEHMDHDLSGNIGQAKDHMSSKKHYNKWKESGKPDHEYYRLSEIRFKKPIPKEFISGVMKKI